MEPQPSSSEYDFTYYPLVVISCATFLSLYKWTFPSLSRALFSDQYMALTDGRKVEWLSRVNSNVHAVIVSCFCIYICAFDNIIVDNPVWGKSWMVNCICAIVMGYMISDAILMTFNYKAIGSIFYFLHHLSIILAYIFVITYRVLPWFANFRILGELSTPFVNQRWFFDVSGFNKKSPLYMINSVIMAIVFFVVRIATIPLYWYRVYDISGTEECYRIGPMWYAMITCCLLLDVINIYWLYKIYLGARRILVARKTT